MEPRPYRYRIEHHDGQLAPVVLEAFLTLRAARSALLLATVRLQRAGATGHLVLVDQGTEPESVVETYTMPASWGADWERHGGFDAADRSPPPRPRTPPH